MVPFYILTLKLITKQNYIYYIFEYVNPINHYSKVLCKQLTVDYLITCKLSVLQNKINYHTFQARMTKNTALFITKL